VGVYGVLALQGDWQAHSTVLRKLGAEVREVRLAEQLEGLAGLVLPGGESTAMLRLMEPPGLAEALRVRIAAGLPVLATCAGIILLAARVSPDQASLGLLDVHVVRNAYGRQVFSSVSDIELSAVMGPPATVRGVFIRAPRISHSGPAVEVLGCRDGEPVLVRERALIAATYHPELSDDCRVHELLISSGEHRDA
jgi:5'-phosphate synthase pdxT subunit